MIIAPWLQNTSPTDYLRAAEAGTQAGNEIARLNVGRQINQNNLALSQQQMQQQAQEALARQLLARQELLQRARQAQAQNALQLGENQSREMLGLVGQQRMEDDSQKAEAARQAQIALEGKRVDLEKDRNNRLRYIKSGNGAFSFDPVTGEAKEIIQPTAPTPKTDTASSRLNLLLKAYPNLDAASQPKVQKEIASLLNPDTTNYRTVTPENVAPSLLNPPPTLQPTGPKVGDTVNGGVFAGGGTLPVAAGVPTNATAAPLQPASSKPKPSSADVSYLASHPEKKAAFEARFGVGSADAYLP